MSFCTRGSETSSQGEGPAPAAKATVATVLASSASQAAGAPTSHASAFVSTLRYAFAPFRFLLSVFAAISSSVIPEIGTGACTSGASLSPEVCQIGVPTVLSHQHAMIAQNNSEGVYQLEWIADSGAGRDLASFQAFEAQGVPTSVSQRAVSSEGSVRFETGNGHVTSDAVVHANGNQVGKASFRMLDACPLVRSLGQFFESGMPFVWLPGELPFLGSDAHSIQVTAAKRKIVVANRVEDHVLIFAETINVIRWNIVWPCSIIFSRSTRRCRLRCIRGSATSN
jgi:hypothetical protein